MNDFEQSGRSRLVEEARDARGQRASERKRLQATLAIQAGARGYLARKGLGALVRSQLDAIIGPAFDDPENYKSAPLPVARNAFRPIRALCFVFNPEEDRERFYRVARYLLSSLESKEVKVNIVSLALTKETILPWAKTMKALLWEACKYLHQSKLELPNEIRELNVGLHLLVSFTGIFRSTNKR